MCPEGPTGQYDDDPDLFATLTDEPTTEPSAVEYTILHAENLQLKTALESAEAQNRELTEENQLLVEQVEYLYPLAYTDQLTKLGNRHKLIEDFNALRVAGVEFGVLFIDINNFKKVNERLSHEGGDATLAMTADSIQSTVYEDLSKAFRPEDTVTSRRGGDEFIVLLPYVRRPPAEDGSREPSTHTMDEILELVATRYRENFLTKDEVIAYNQAVSEQEQLGLNIGTARDDGISSMDQVLARADPKGRDPEYFKESLALRIPGWAMRRMKTAITQGRIVMGHMAGFILPTSDSDKD